jgi:short subunit dehydrogenase-like uncharacterized protein
MRGALSGGTLESGMEMERNLEVFAQLKDPFLLGGRPPHPPRQEDADITEAAPLASSLRHQREGAAAAAVSEAAAARTVGSAIGGDDDGSGAWTSVFMMAELNTRTVRRSHSLYQGLDDGGAGTGHGYGSEFGYNERVLCRSEEEARKMARPPPPISKREAMRSEGRLPKQGEGPSPEQRAKSKFKFFFVGEGEESGRRVVTTVAGGDPGYDETAKMVSESALALASDRGELHATKVAGLKGGVLTPAFAFGEVLERRLSQAGIAFADEGPVFDATPVGDKELRSLLGAAVGVPSAPHSKL